MFVFHLKQRKAPVTDKKCAFYSDRVNQYFDWNVNNELWSNNHRVKKILFQKFSVVMEKFTPVYFHLRPPLPFSCNTCLNLIYKIQQSSLCLFERISLVNLLHCKSSTLYRKHIFAGLSYCKREIKNSPVKMAKILEIIDKVNLRV